MLSLEESCQSLIRYWQEQGYPIRQRDMLASLKYASSLPADFLYLYSQVNGMDQWYNYGIDKEGFAFYAIEEIVSCQEEFSASHQIKQDFGAVLLFADYLHKCWWYGVQLNPYCSNGYTIGVVPMEGIFVPITDSLAVFLELYIADADELYNWKE